MTAELEEVVVTVRRAPRRSTPHQISASDSSISPEGGSYARAAYAAPSGAGSALRSSFPLAVSGNDSSRTYAAGTMYSGNTADRCARSPSTRRPLRRAGCSTQPAAFRRHDPRARAPRLHESTHDREAGFRSRPARSGVRGSSPGSRCGRETRCCRQPDSARRRPVLYEAIARHETAWDEAFGRELRPVQIAARDLRTADVQFARYADRDGLAVCVQNVVRVFAIGRPIGTVSRPGVALPGRHVDRSFRRAVQIVQLRRRQAFPNTPDQIAAERLAAANARRERLQPVLRVEEDPSIDGTKCTVVICCSRITRVKYAGSFLTIGPPSTSFAPFSNGQNTSHTDTSKLKTGLLQDRVVRTQLVSSTASRANGLRPRGARSSPLWAGRSSPTCRSRTPGARA